MQWAVDAGIASIAPQSAPTESHGSLLVEEVSV